MSKNKAMDEPAPLRCGTCGRLYVNTGGGHSTCPNGHGKLAEAIPLKQHNKAVRAYVSEKLPKAKLHDGSNGTVYSLFEVGGNVYQRVKRTSRSPLTKPGERRFLAVWQGKIIELYRKRHRDGHS